MSIFSKLVQKYKRATPKQLMLTGVFMLAFAAAIGGGFASRTTSSAMPQDCDNNAVMRCGFTDGPDFARKAYVNAPGDIDNIYHHVGLPIESWNDFAANAKQGTFFRDGRVEVEGEVIATNGKSMGRQNYGNSTSMYVPGAGTYYYGSPSQRWSSGVQSIPAMVWFDDNGVVRAIIMNPCGNPLPHYDKRTPFVKCEALNKHDVAGKKNTYRFSTTASKDGYGLARYVKFNYYLNNETQPFATTTDPAALTPELTLTKTSTVRVEIEYNLPGSRNKIRTIKSDLCKRTIEVKQFSYVCESLIATSADNKTFRFTLKTKQSEGVTVKSADFKLDDKTPTTVLPVSGVIYRDYSFTDYTEHTVRVSKIVFTVDGEDKSVVTPEGKCVAKVKRDKPPVCPYNPSLPPNHPDCKAPECVEKPGSGLPPGHPDCKPKTETCEDNPGKEGCELPSTGPAGVAGLFAGVTAAGAVGHRLFQNYRSRREQ